MNLLASSDVMPGTAASKNKANEMEQMAPWTTMFCSFFLFFEGTTSGACDGNFLNLVRSNLTHNPAIALTEKNDLGGTNPDCKCFSLSTF